MLTDLMEAQKIKLIQSLQENSGYIQPTVVGALALLDILDILGDIRSPSNSGD